MDKMSMALASYTRKIRDDKQQIQNDINFFAMIQKKSALSFFTLKVNHFSAA